jgi:hypothetical protein
MLYEFTCESCGASIGPYKRRRQYTNHCKPCRFWKRVAKAGADDCWLWAGPLDKNGYGITGLGTTPDIQRSHRAAWTFTRGGIPKGLCVCHTCDNPLCCNPGHMWLGTNAENTRDRETKGRSSRNLKPMLGERHGMSKLTAPDVIRIRRLIDSGSVSHLQISREYGVSKHAIHCILHRKTWKHV